MVERPLPPYLTLGELEWSSEWGPTSHFNTIFGPFRSVIYAIVIRTIWVKSKAYETVISNCSGKSFICITKSLVNFTSTEVFL